MGVDGGFYSDWIPGHLFFWEAWLADTSLGSSYQVGPAHLVLKWLSQKDPKTIGFRELPVPQHFPR